MAEVDVTNKRIFYRSSHPDMFCKKGVLEYLANFIGKHQYRTLFLKEVWSCRPATLFQKRLMYRFFFCEMFKTLQNRFFILHLRISGQFEKNFRKNYLKKSSLIRVKSHGFYRSLLLKNFISFSLRKTFSLNLLLKSDFKRCLG